MEEVYKINETEASLIVDDFTNENTIQITKVAGSYDNLYIITQHITKDLSYSYDAKKVSFQPAFYNEQFYLKIKSDIYLHHSDKFLFFFENNLVIETIIDYNIKLPQQEHSYFVQLSAENVKKFCTVFLKKWRIEFSTSKIFHVGTFIDYKFFSQYQASEDGQFLFLLMFRKLVEQILFHYPIYLPILS